LYNKLKQWRVLATRYDKLAVVFRGGAMPHPMLTERGLLGTAVAAGACAALVATAAGALAYYYA